MGFEVVWEFKAPTILETAAIPVAKPLKSMAREVAASKMRVKRVGLCIVF